jgi:hypothetical protein
MNSFFPRAIIGGPSNPGIPVVIGTSEEIMKKGLRKHEQGLNEQTKNYLGKQRIFLLAEIGSAA